MTFYGNLGSNTDLNWKVSKAVLGRFFKIVLWIRRTYTFLLPYVLLPFIHCCYINLFICVILFLLAMCNIYVVFFIALIHATELSNLQKPNPFAVADSCLIHPKVRFFSWSTVSSSIMRYLPSCETSLYENPLNKNRVKSEEKKVARHPKLNLEKGHRNR